MDLKMNDAFASDNRPNAPDWELIERMSNLDKPIDGVPNAPDLESLLVED